jgi:UDP-glucose 4-epimerase
MKKVLVVGANSYIGKKFKEHVEANHRNEIIVDMVSASDGSWEVIDFSMYEVVVHLAAIVHKKERKKMEPLYYKVNHQLVVDVVHKAKESGVKQFVFMSTAAVYGSKVRYITNETIPNPDTYYGKSKLGAEAEITEICEGSIILSILRPPMVYGEGCKGNYEILRKAACVLPAFPAYKNKRSVIHINTLTKYMLDVIVNQCRGIYHPHDSKLISTVDLVTEIRNQIGKDTLLVKNFNQFIETLLKHNRFNKIFGDFYYENLQ